MLERATIFLLLIPLTLLLSSGCAGSVATSDRSRAVSREDSLGDSYLEEPASTSRYNELSRRELDSLSERELAELALLEARSTSEISWPSILSSIVAVAALLFAYWQSRWLIRHNKATVQPHIRFDRRMAKPGPVHIVIVNAGAGSAIIRKFYIRFKSEDREEAVNPSDFSQASKFLNKCLDSLDVQAKVGCSDILAIARVLGPEDALRPGEEVILWEIEGISGDFDKRVELRSLLSSISFEVEYSSIYREAAMSTERPEH